MLVLTRKVGEWIDIGDDVRVQVVAIGRSQVRLGLEAPREKQILRDDARKQKGGEACE